jgi:hypothetical protein
MPLPDPPLLMRAPEQQSPHPTPPAPTPPTPRLHFVLVIVYNLYAMCVLFWHFRRYVIIRHSYLTRGAGWRGGGQRRRSRRLGGRRPRLQCS